MKLLKFFYILIFIFLNTFCDQQKCVYILIHGTWAVGSNWHNSQGEFYKKLSKSVDKLQGSLIPFLWTGTLNHECRLEAGKHLAELVSNLSTSNTVYIIGHSHGANVGIIASQILAEKNKKNCIKSFYALGAPVDTKLYMPNMNVIESYYHLYSTTDLIQPVLGFYERSFPAHDRIANIKITVDGKSPNHSDTHSPIIGYWIPFIHEHLSKYKFGNFENFSFTKPGLISFERKKIPTYEIDWKQTNTKTFKAANEKADQQYWSA